MSVDRIKELIEQYNKPFEGVRYEWRSLASGYFCTGRYSGKGGHEPTLNLYDDAVRAERQMLGIHESCRLCGETIWREVRT